ncbi:hypothetical protein BaRGS_00018421, partial [Batillaria attramentaria]
MKVRPFAGVPNIVELECTGKTLTTDMDLLSLSLYSIPGGKTLAYVNLRKKECSMSNAFSSCVIDAYDARATRVTVLVTGLSEHETRTYGCDVTSLEAGGRPKITVWRVTVTQLMKNNKFPDSRCEGGRRSSPRMKFFLQQRGGKNRAGELTLPRLPGLRF